jgi:hypothetical protein
LVDDTQGQKPLKVCFMSRVAVKVLSSANAFTTEQTTTDRILPTGAIVLDRTHPTAPTLSDAALVTVETMAFGRWKATWNNVSLNIL